ncbi:MAG: glutathione S-transferase C-terminal domain-containing protein [Alphaproteobacteria bacterium]
MDTGPLLLSGAPGSPYTRKMMAYLRYRLVPFRVIYGLGQASASGDDRGLPKPKVQLLPTFYLPGPTGELEAVVDSTPLIRRFEKEIKGRHAVPTHPVLRFLNDLLEDYGDEWLTKAMFHYRWYYDADIAKARSILPRWGKIEASEELMEQMAGFFGDRQISRLYVVGSNDTTAPVIEDSYKRYLDLMKAHLETMPFLLGQRPSSADFSAYGQLTQLAQFDPTPMAVTLERAPRVYAWVDLVDDLSGLEVAGDEGWIDPANVPDTLRALLGEVGRVYAPALLANADALNNGQDEMRTEIDGREWVQKPFAYQGKCLLDLRKAYADLDDAARSTVDDLIDGTGLEPLFIK